MITTTDPRTETRLKEEFVNLKTNKQFQKRVIPTSNLVLASLQLIVGYAWLLPGVDKILLGTFPEQIGGIMSTTINGGRLPDFFVAMLQGLVLPNAALFGFVIEWAETLAGLGLITAGLVMLLRPYAKRFLKGRMAVLFAFGESLLAILAPLAAAGAGMLGLSYFVLDGMPAPWFTPSVAYGGAINTGLFLAATSVIIIAGYLTQGYKVKYTA